MDKKIPKLRFKEFTGEWEEKRLGEICEINPKTEKLPNEFFYIDLESVENGILKNKKLILKENAPSRAKRVVQKGDILYQTVRPYQQNNLYISFQENISYVASTGYAQLRSSENNTKYIYYLIHIKKFLDKVLERCTGTSYPAINSEDLSNINIFYIQNKQEQEKIANFLSSVDKKISLTEEKLELFKNYKKGIMQKIFSQKLRFKDENGNDYPEWEEKKIGDILKEYIEKTTRNNQYQVLSSTATGIYLQEEYFKKQVASNDNTGYKILKKNQLVFSPQNLWLGNININLKYDIGIVSPSYKIFNINIDKVCIKYLKEIIKTTNMLEEYKNSSEQGASIVRRNLDMTLFIRILINLPCLEEQEKIANFLSSIDKKIEKIENELENLKEFKKGLLQQMFI